MSLKLCSLFAVASLAACSSQVDGDHQGDALAIVKGSVRNARSKPVPSSEVAVVWINSSGSPDLMGADTVDVAGNFPAQFSLSIYTPPAAELVNNWHGVGVGVAYIIAGEEGMDYSNPQSLEAGLLGMDEDHLLVYLPAAVPAGSDASIVLRGTPAAGFHLYDVHKLTDAESAAREACIDGLGSTPTLHQVYTQCGGEAFFDDFVPSATDLGTPLEIDLVDDISEIDAPNWT
jgi:hypothetical protein